VNRPNAYFIQLVENVVVSYLYAVITFFLLHQADVLTFDLLKGAVYAGIPAALAVLKGFLATFVRSPDSPQLSD
jgi:hypothetical protein